MLNYTIGTRNEESNLTRNRQRETQIAPTRAHWIAVARGDETADVVLTGGSVLSVFTGEVFRADVAIVDGHIVGVGDYAGAEEIDVSGRYLVPGFMDGHCHIESSKLSVHEFARAVLRCGTTSVVVDPHELANVLGVAGIEYVLEASECLPLDVYVMIPSCVPASRFETPLVELAAGDTAHLLEHPRVIGLAEMMNYPAVIAGQLETLQKLEAVGWKRIDGHAPSVAGRELNAYLVGGPRTDHECITQAEALEKRRLGMWIMIREASMIRNLKELLPMVKRFGTENTLFVTDDREADTLLHEGHINAMVRLAVAEGLSVGDAVKLASLNVARCHGIEDLGAVAPGYRADICVLPDLQSFIPEMVLKDGTVVVRHGYMPPIVREPTPADATNTVCAGSVTAADLAVSAGGSKAPLIRAIEIVPDQVVTRKVKVEGLVSGDQIVGDPERDLAKVAVIERHRATGNVGLGFVRGMGLRRGAIASTVAHDAHNIVVVGMSDGDMLTAVERLVSIGGGLTVVSGGNVLGDLPLPIAGLMSDRSAEEVDAGIHLLEGEARKLGLTISMPFMYLSFLALSVIPELRVTDQGIVDVTEFRLVPLMVGQE